MNIVYKYQSISEYSLDNLRRRKLWAPYPSDLNDPFEFRLKASLFDGGLDSIRETNPGAALLSDAQIIDAAITELHSVLHKMGVVCFTTRPDNTLMWSHYADMHRGFCVGFTSPQPLSQVGIYPVKYPSELQSLKFDNPWSVSGAAGIIWIKSQDWKYEDEYRKVLVEGRIHTDYPGKLSHLI